VKVVKFVLAGFNPIEKGEQWRFTIEESVGEFVNVEIWRMGGRLQSKYFPIPISNQLLSPMGVL
jgi:hypothetical protein